MADSGRGHGARVAEQEKGWEELKAAHAGTATSSACGVLLNGSINWYVSIYPIHQSARTVF